MSSIDRREFLTSVSAGVAVGVAPLGSEAANVARAPDEGAQAAASRIAGLADPAFRPLPLGAIRPAGWLQRQLRIQADGLTGHLDEFWPDVAQSQWFGGKAEGWERAPYWLDGAIPLAWLLDDGADEGAHHALRRPPSSPTSAPTAGTRRIRSMRWRSATTSGPSCSPTRRSRSTTKRPATRACSPPS